MNIRKNIDYSEMYESLDKMMVQQLPEMELYCEIGKVVSWRTEKGAAVAVAEYLDKKYPDVQGFSPRNLRRIWFMRGPVRMSMMEVWHQPEIDSPNPKLGYQVIIGRTKVLSMIKPEGARIRQVMELEDRGEHLKILQTPGFINTDCGCGFDMPKKVLACIRQEDMVEYYQ